MKPKAPRLATLFGGQGFIGSHLAQRLRADGWRVQLAARDAAVTSQDLGCVFYCAGLTADYVLRPHDTVRAHVGLLNELLQSAQFDALVYLSSTRLYDAQPQAAQHEDSALALNPANPRHLYDLSKALGESLCQHTGGGRARIARLSCVHAGSADTSGFIGSLLRQVQAETAAGRQAPLEIDADAQGVRDYVHINDVLDSLIAMATRGTQTVYNVASGVNLSNAQLFARLSELAGFEIRASRAYDHGRTQPCPEPVSIQRAQQEFGWHPAPLLSQLEDLVQDRVQDLMQEAATCSP